MATRVIAGSEKTSSTDWVVRMPGQAAACCARTASLASQTRASEPS